MISVLDPKREVGLWHSMLTVSTSYLSYQLQRKGLCCGSHDKFTEFLPGFQFLFAECDEWNACYLCTTISFKEFTSDLVADGNKTQRYETVPVTSF